MTLENICQRVASFMTDMRTELGVSGLELHKDTCPSPAREPFGEAPFLDGAAPALRQKRTHMMVSWRGREAARVSVAVAVSVCMRL